MDEKDVEQQQQQEQYLSSDEVLKGAEQAVEHEHNMTLRECLRKYPKACFWSVWFSAALIMEGFDHAFVTGFFSFPEFQKRYGVLESSGSYQIPAELQSGIGNGVNAGEIIGLLLNGFFVDHFGYRWVMIGSLFLMCCFIFLQFFATSIYMYLGAEVLLGLPWGVFQTLSTTYAAEVCPTTLRPYLTMLVSMCWSIGYLIGTGALRGFLQMTGEWAYRIPFALQWALPLPLAIGIFLAPESPWWLIRKGRTEEATKSLRRLQSNVGEDELANTVSMMVYTVKIEDEMNTTSSYLDLFKGVNFRRTEATIGVYLIQVFLAPLVGNVVYFLEQAGLSSADSFDFGVGEYSLAIIAVLVAFFLSKRMNRRTLLLTGIAFMCSTTYLIAFLGIPNLQAHKSIAYGIGSILLIEYFVYFCTVGTNVYTVVTELPSTYLRTKSVAVARATYNVVSLCNGQLTPHMIQTAAWNWGAKAGFYYGTWMGLIGVWVYFRAPETKGRTFAEIDILFKNKVSARKFATTKVDLATQTIVE
ncbi:general substrate transporter [Xylariales sp. PMI_506]|nr:general substrate transporter [Xylariales sp. PMI_506]